MRNVGSYVTSFRLAEPWLCAITVAPQRTCLGWQRCSAYAPNSDMCEDISYKKLTGAHLTSEPHVLNLWYDHDRSPTCRGVPFAFTS